MAGYDIKPHSGETHPFAMTRTRRHRGGLLATASAIAAIIAVPAPPAQAQQLPVWQPLSPQYVQCPAPGQPLLQIPEIVTQNGKLRGTIVLGNAAQRMYLGNKLNINPNATADPSQCLVQEVRQFLGSGAVLPAYAGSIPPGYPGYVPPPSYPGYQPLPPGPNVDPVPGPTLRAKLGDIVELAFLNQIASGGYWSTIDRGEKGQGCDQSTAPYPGLDVYPDCFHGSTTGNIHFHGTHTNPGTAGDNVFIEVRPSLRDASGQPVVTEASVSGPFGDFFTSCETELNKSVLSQWPRTWNDFPPAWVATQESLLKQYDDGEGIVNKLWPVDDAQRKAGAWPQYYIGATPYCFRLPAYTPPGPSQSAHPANHGGAGAGEQTRALQMGQAPGTHWYHAHKHGSTAIDVSNGMTGAFIIEGGYDDALNQFYGPSWSGPQSWSRSQPVLVVNQLGTSPNLFGGGKSGGGPAPFSVNGRFQPALTMQPGQVQLWRIANTSSRGAIFVNGFALANAAAPSSPQVFAWKQIAQDGVQFTGSNYAASQNPNLLLFAGNRADVLVQAPATPGQYVLLVQQVRSRCATLPSGQIPLLPTSRPSTQPPTPVPTPICGPDDPSPVPFLMVNVSGPPATGSQAQFIPPDQFQLSFPPFLADIKDSEVKGTRTVVFESTATAAGTTPHAMHTIDGQKFDGNIGQAVLLNTVEEWKIVNNTVNGGVQVGTPPAADVVVATDPPGVVDHPFHIHINPFQITEFFDPNQFVPDPNTKNELVPKYVTGGKYNKDVQCLLDIKDPTTWRDCHNTPQPDRIWWDVFAIPSARAVFTTTGSTITQTTIPGYFKMRSRFVDFTGQYVLHCHILAHEDRGMMTVVEVVPFTTAYSHK
jgi:FtsP/CotA-like multicopper oxidase with cupredoxin domain